MKRTGIKSSVQVTNKQDRGHGTKANNAPADKPARSHAPSARTKALDITKKVKDRVWERDGEKCVICGSRYAMPNMHYISRAQSGLGIEENVVTGCIECHNAYDNGGKRAEIGEKVKAYLDGLYPDFTDDMRRYQKGA